MKFKKFFSLLVLIQLTSTATTSSSALDIVIGKFQTQVEKDEKRLINEQVEFKTNINTALSRSKSSENSLNSNRHLKNLNQVLLSIIKTLTEISITHPFNTSDFHKQNVTACKKINLMWEKLETDMINYLQAKKTLDDDTNFVAHQTNKLKLEYFTNYIFFTNTTSDSTVKTIAILERMNDKNHKFSSNLYLCAFQIANVLFDIKVVKFESCDNRNFTSSTTKAFTKNSGTMITSIKTTVPMTTTISRKTDANLGPVNFGN